MSDMDLILLVEDEPDIREIASLALEDDFELVVCASGEDAIDKADSIRPKAMVLDVMMPGLDGPKTLQRLRAFEHLKEVPAIFMTAKVQPSEIDEYLALGAVGVVSKPFDPMSLATEVRELLDRA